MLSLFNVCIAASYLVLFSLWKLWLNSLVCFIQRWFSCMISFLLDCCQNIHFIVAHDTVSNNDLLLVQFPFSFNLASFLAIIGIDLFCFSGLHI